ncbi:hypothetical protein AB1E18_010928 [Capra hircus]
MLADFLTKRKVISFSSCATQFAFFVGFVDAECYVLAAMAYDRFVAICRPLRYSALMSRRVCLALMLGSYLAGLILVTCISEDKSISLTGCAVQFFFSAGLAYSECYLLAAMAYDRYVAISSPLLYAQVMSRRLCICLVIYSYTGGFVNAIILTSNTFTLNFCGGNIIDDFFCDVPPLVKLACDVKETYQDVLYFLLASNVITPTVLILASYAFIIAAILRIRSTQGRLKAFSTCSSHLISVTLYYGSILYIYSRPSSNYSLERDKVVSTFYTVVFPMLNPMIYSLRNTDVKDALKKLSRFT